MSPLVKFVLLTALILGLVIVCAKPLGGYIADIMEGRNNFASRPGDRFERWIYRISGVKPSEEMSWWRYAIALLPFNLGGAHPGLVGSSRWTCGTKFPLGCNGISGRSCTHSRLRAALLENHRQLLG